MADVLFPRTADEAVSMKNENSGSRFLAGGTDLFVEIRHTGKKPHRYISFDKTASMHAIAHDDESISIGAASTFQQIADDEECRRFLPLLCDAVAQMSSPQVVHMATIGGNIATASPAGDALPPLYAYDAMIAVASPAGTRNVPVSDLLLGPWKTALGPDELISAVIIPRPAQDELHRFIKVGQRNALAIAIVSLAARWTLSPDGEVISAALAWGSAAPTVVRSAEIDAMLTGKKLTVSALERVIPALQSKISPITDIRASAEYRRTAAGNILKKICD